MGTTKIKEPAFPLYSQDFIIGCADMKWQDIGKYITLLCYQHQKGHLTDDVIKKLIGNFSPELKMKFVQDSEGRYYNEKLDGVLMKRKIHREKQSENVTNRYTKMLPTELPKCYQDPYQNATNGATKMLPLENENNNNIRIQEYRRIIPPSYKIVDIYCKMRKNNIDARYFVDYYSARGWVYGKQKTAIVDWQAVVRTWEKNNAKPNGSNINLTELNDEKNRYKR
jgi:hypothetical protein